MPLNSFGAILSFAEELEIKKKEFYHDAAGKDLDHEVLSLFQILEKEGEKQVRLIQRTRRENVTEMILEPVIDFFREPFSIDTGIPDERDQVLARAGQIEATVLSFYSQASVKLKALAEVARTLKQLGKRQKARLEKLNRL
jgi:hypothetical protein